MKDFLISIFPYLIHISVYMEKLRKMLCLYISQVIILVTIIIVKILSAVQKTFFYLKGSIDMDNIQNH